MAVYGEAEDAVVGIEEAVPPEKALFSRLFLQRHFQRLVDQVLIDAPRVKLLDCEGSPNQQTAVTLKTMEPIVAYVA